MKEIEFRSCTGGEDMDIDFKKIELYDLDMLPLW